MKKFKTGSVAKWIAAVVCVLGILAITIVSNAKADGQDREESWPCCPNGRCCDDDAACCP